MAVALAGVRSRARTMLLAQRLGLFLAGCLAIVVAAGVGDYIVRMPMAFRLVLWLAGVAGVAFAAHRYLRPVWKFWPSLTDLALRIERSDEGRRAGLAGVLASGLELADIRADSRATGPSSSSQSGTTGFMSERVIEDASRRFGGVRAASILAPRLTTRNIGLFGATLVAVAGLWITWPGLTQTGAARVLAPWSGAEWPRRTGVADATGVEVHPLGTALPLRAAITRTDRREGQTNVGARYRLVTGDRAGPVRKVLLTGQSRRIEVAGPGNGVESGELYERLIEPGDLMAGGGSEGDGPADAAFAELEYWFETSDDRTEPRRLKLVEPPAIMGAAALVTPPAYAGEAEENGAVTLGGVISGRVDLGPGSDERAVMRPVLAGSRVELALDLNKPVPTPTPGQVADGGPVWRAWLEETLGLDPDTEVEAAFSGDQWTLAWTIARSIRLPVRVTDEFSLSNVDEAAYSFEVIEDRAPAATITEPAQDEAVLATAALGVEGEGQDDVGVRWVAIERQRARPPGESMGAAPEADGEPTEVARRETGANEAGARAPRQASSAARVELGPLELGPGDELWLTAVVQDNYSFQGAEHPPVRSTPRKLRIISESDLIEEVQNELGGVRQAAIRLEADQQEVARQARRAPISPEARAAQGAIGERLARQELTVRKLAERLARNGLADQGLDGLLDSSGELLDGAGESSSRAAGAMDGASGREPTPEERERLEEAQQEVRDDLEELIALLDRGQDSWVARRSLERLLAEQRQMMAETAQLAESLTGKPAEELTAQEQSALDRAAQKQEELARQASKTVQELGERSEQLQQADPSAAAAMAQAAQRGEQRQVPERLRQAGEQIGQNQTQSAQQQQQEAIEAMEQMLEDLDDAEQNRDETLRRILASLMESLDGLIARQQKELDALAQAKADGAFAGLDQGMIRLHQNTLGVLDQAREGGDETAPVAALIDEAGEAQVGAISALRATPVDPTGAETGEGTSLEKLKEARAEAQRLDEEAQARDQDRKRRELRTRYRELLELQVALRGDTAGLIGQELGRRERAAVRGLGERQESVREQLATLREETEELADAGVFDYAHTRLDRTTGDASKALRAGGATPAVGRNQGSAIRILQSLVEALDDAPSDDEFREGEQGGGGGGGGGADQPLIPPIAELRLLRGMQQEAAELTRALDEDADGAEAGELEQVGDLQRELAEQGEVLIEKMGAPPPGGPPPGQESPAPEGSR